MDAPPDLWRGDRGQPGLRRLRVAAGGLDGASIRVRGLGLLGVATAETVARAGASAISLVDATRSEPETGAVAAISTGSRAARAARLLASLRPDLVIALDATRRVDAEIVTAYGAVDPVVQHRLMLGGPHVALLADEAGVSVQPVAPGRSACLRCRDLELAAADPAWPLLARQCEALPATVTSVDAAAAGALATASVAALLAGSVPDGWRVEAGLPRRRSQRAAAACGCGAAG